MFREVVLPYRQAELMDARGSRGRGRGLPSALGGVGDAALRRERRRSSWAWLVLVLIKVIDGKNGED